LSISPGSLKILLVMLFSSSFFSSTGINKTTGVTQSKQNLLKLHFNYYRIGKNCLICLPFPQKIWTYEK
jgi:hypothetical protein